MGVARNFLWENRKIWGRR